MRLAAQVIIAPKIEDAVSQLEALVTDEHIVKVIKEDRFLLEDAKFAIEKAYLTNEHQTFVILGAKFFPPEIQNKLLKVIEEPPPDVAFILITPSKATILPTVRSRLPMTILKETYDEEPLTLDIGQLDLASAYKFIQSNKRIDMTTAKLYIEKICKEAMRSQRYHLDEKSLQLFSDLFNALDRGSPVQFVLTTLLLKLLAKKKKQNI
jgi:DNA polymerase-3 subunit delta'